MDVITSYPLGDDIAWTLLAVTLVGVASVVLGAVVPRRLARDEDSAGLDPDLGTRLGALLSAAVRTALSIGVPVLLLLLLVPGSLEVRVLRSAMMLVGILAGAAAAWRATGILVPALALEGEARRRGISRIGALLIASTLALAVVPVAVIVWFLRGDAGTSLLAFALGAAVFALSARVTTSFTDIAADASALLGGADENELDREAEDNPGAVHTRLSALFRRGPARAAEIVAVAAAVLAAGIAIGVAVLTVEGMIVPLLGGGIAMLVALLVAVLPHFGTEGSERETLRLGALIPSIVGAGALAATVVFWLPTTYKSLRFAKVGLDTFTDAALTGGDPVARSELEPQIEQAAQQFSTMLSQADESAGSRTILDTIAIYGVNPAVVVAVAVAVGAVLALVAQALVSYAADRRNTPTLAIARTSRTGGALGALTALGSAGTTAALVVVVLVVGLVALGVTAGGIGMLTLLLVAYAGLGALIVVAGHAAVHVAASLGDRAGSEQPLRDATRSADVAAGTGIQVAAVLAALAVLAPVTNAIYASARASSLWEDRAMHDMTPGSVFGLAGIAIGIATVLFVGTSLLESGRRIGATAVIDTRAALLEKGTGRVHLAELAPLTRKAAVAPLVIAVVMPVLVGFGIGAAALPGYLGGVVLTALVLAVWTGAADASMRSAVDVIETGRYGGRGSWGHSAALGNAVLGTGLRATIGQLALPAAITTSLVTVMGIGAFVSLSTNGTSVYLRWGIAVVALLVVIVASSVTASVPEPDLEDFAEDLDEPLFGRRVEETEAEATDWDAFAGDDESDREEVVVPRYARGRRETSKKSASTKKPTTSARRRSRR